MHEKLEGLLVRWLHSLKITISPSYIYSKLKSHPDYPSLLSVTDTLDALHIDNAVLIADKEKIHEIPVPFLAYISSKKGSFVLVKNTSRILRKHPDFLKQWNGVTVTAEKPTLFNDTENEIWLNKEKKRKQGTTLGITVLLALGVVALFMQFSMLATGLMVTTIAGLTVSVFIIQHELGLSSSLTRQLCEISQTTDCDAVLSSGKSKVLSWLNLSDIAIIWFSSLFLIVTIFLFSNTIESVVPLLTAFSVATLPLTLFSLYYQWHVVKKWCPLCLLTVAVLWAQAIILLPGTGNIDIYSISPNTIALVSLIFAVAAVNWILLLKPVLIKARYTTDKYYHLLRFKNNSDVFEVLLKQQKKADAIPFENDLQIGNPDSPSQIIVACNPYCKPCAEAHKVIHHLPEHTDTGLIIRFAVKSYNSQSDEVATVHYLLQVIYEKTNHLAPPAKIHFIKMVLADWFELMNLELFKLKYPATITENIHPLVYDCWNWSRENDITTVPSIFINGYLLPRVYKVDDLTFFLKETQDKTFNHAKI